MYLKEVDFGRDVAEFDRHLSDFFIETNAYDQVKKGNRSLVIGRKGTGKTAILKYSMDTENKVEFGDAPHIYSFILLVLSFFD